jgi:hypothetical protein
MSREWARAQAAAFAPTDEWLATRLASATASAAAS